jgi:hypothetical protein
MLHSFGLLFSKDASAIQRRAGQQSSLNAILGEEGQKQYRHSTHTRQARGFEVR